MTLLITRGATYRLSGFACDQLPYLAVNFIALVEQVTNASSVHGDLLELFREAGGLRNELDIHAGWRVTGLNGCYAVGGHSET